MSHHANAPALVYPAVQLGLAAALRRFGQIPSVRIGHERGDERVFEQPLPVAAKERSACVTGLKRLDGGLGHDFCREPGRGHSIRNGCRI
jgi:hypothetical protein